MTQNAQKIDEGSSFTNLRRIYIFLGMRYQKEYNQGRIQTEIGRREKKLFLCDKFLK